MASRSASALALAALLSTTVFVAVSAGGREGPGLHGRHIADGGTSPATGNSDRVVRNCSDGCPQMVMIPAGGFLMGSEKFGREGPLHPVKIDKAIAVGRFEITFDEWGACVRGGGCVRNTTPSDQGWGRGRRPVINVSWDDAEAYVSWLSRKTGKSYRLLTEAEWEYAARAGSTTSYSWGDRIDCSKASYDGGRGPDCAARSGWFSLRGTQSVGSYSANRWGLYDMLGNVWE